MDGSPPPFRFHTTGRSLAVLSETPSSVDLFFLRAHRSSVTRRQQVECPGPDNLERNGARRHHERPPFRAL